MSHVSYVYLLSKTFSELKQPLNSGIINNRAYKRIITTCIEQPKLDFSQLLPWTLCTIVKDEYGAATRSCDLDDNHGRLEDVCIKNGCMDQTPESWQQ